MASPDFRYDVTANNYQPYALFHSRLRLDITCGHIPTNEKKSMQQSPLSESQ